jgi:septal ring factor EnvC (AmiA/AmiB activator)
MFIDEQGKMRQMSITKDLNLGTVIPIFLFLLLQTGGLIWMLSEFRSDITDLQDANMQQVAEQLRQWARINENEDDIALLTSGIREINAELRSLRRDVTTTNQNIQELNSLIRQALLNEQGTPR